MPLVQIEPRNVSLAAIASGKYDAYLSGYAAAVRAYRHPVILSFGHEMNGQWFPWGYRHDPGGGVRGGLAAHRDPVPRAGGPQRDLAVDGQTNTTGTAPVRPWWPGRSYVNWVGIDGYYYKPSWAFVSLFGPTIVKVRALTKDPDPHRRDGRGARGRPGSEDRRPVPGRPRIWAAGIRVVQRPRGSGLAYQRRRGGRRAPQRRQDVRAAEAMNGDPQAPAHDGRVTGVVGRYGWWLVSLGFWRIAFLGRR